MYYPSTIFKITIIRISGLTFPSLFAMKAQLTSSYYQHPPWPSSQEPAAQFIRSEEQLHIQYMEARIHNEMLFLCTENKGHVWDITIIAKVLYLMMAAQNRISWYTAYNIKNHPSSNSIVCINHTQICEKSIIVLTYTALVTFNCKIFLQYRDINQFVTGQNRKFRLISQHVTNICETS
jgi:hypothetical protein